MSGRIDLLSRRRVFTVVGCMLLIAALLAAYLPAINGGYIWDDDSYVTGNMLLRTTDGLAGIWLEPTASPQYYPLVFTSFWIEYHLWQLHPLGYHLVNVFLHGLNALMLWIILRRLSVPGAWLAAAVFAFHPVHAESVAWITERKNVLSGLFYLAALWNFLSLSLNDWPPWQGRPWWRRYILSLLLYVAALLSKSVTCSLPAVLLLLLWWKKGRLTVRLVATLVPMFVIGLWMGLHTIHQEKFHVGAVGAEWDLSIVERLLLAGRIICFYAAKLVVPMRLTFIYPRWTIDAAVWWQYLFPAGVLMVTVALWMGRRRLGEAPLVALLFFVGTLTPALGFFNVFPMRFSYVADHFQYLASIGPITLAAVMLARWLGGQSLLAGDTPPGRTTSSTAQVRAENAGAFFRPEGAPECSHGWSPAQPDATRGVGAKERALPGGAEEVHGTEPLQGRLFRTRAARAFARAFPGVVLIPLVMLTWRQTHVYADLETLWRDTIAKNPSAWIAHNNLAHVLIKKEKYAEAVPHLKTALELNPEYPEALFSLCGALTEQNPPDPARLDEAIAYCLQGLAVRPNTPLGHNNLCRALSKRGRHDEATTQCEAAIRLRPEWAQARTDLGLAYWRVQDFDQGLLHLRKAVQLAPNNPQAHYNLAVALNQLGDVDGAITQLTAAVQLAPDAENAKRMLATLIARRPPAP